MIAERLTGFPAGATPPPTPPRRYQQWRSQIPFNQDHYFAERLRQDKLNESQFQALLAETAPELQARQSQPPDWLGQLAAAFEQPQPPLPAGIAQQVNQSFLIALAPLLAYSWQQLKASLVALSRRYAPLPFDPTTVGEMALAGLPDRLLLTISRTFVLEMHVARISGRLRGESPESRFQAYLDWLAEPQNRLAVWREYPVLARLIVARLNHWLVAQTELFSRLCADYSAICHTFNHGADIGPLIDLESHLGDSHHNGRTVTALHFANGLKIIYKPRPLEATAHFQHFLTWLNQRSQLPPFRILRWLNRPGYGWLEFVKQESCSSPAGIENFYRRQGAYLAILYALRANDFHFQNIIAAGEQPILIDLETFFQPAIGEFTAERANAQTHNMMMNSVLRVGLLPQTFAHWLDDDAVAIDFSGLGASGGQWWPKLIPTWSGSNTDEMRISHQRERFEGGHNQPLLNHRPVNPLHYAPQIKEGFSQMYQLLLTHQADLLATDGPLAPFAHDEMRVVLRATTIYSMLIKDGRHPDFMRNMLDRERFLDRLWIGIQYRPEWQPLIAHERHDLHSEDVPLFLTRPDSRDLWSANGQHIPNYFDESGWSLTQKRLAKLGSADFSQQLWFVQAALSTLAMNDQQGLEVVSRPEIAHPAPVSPTQFLAAARQIGDRLNQLALPGDDGRVGWIGLSLNQDRWTLNPLGLDLYGGLPGVTLFLAYLGQITGDNSYRQLAEATLQTIRHELNEVKGALKLIGGFSGWGGILYTFSHLAALWHRPELLDQTIEYAAALPPLIEQDRYFDLIGGAAGCLAALNSLYALRPEPFLLKMMVQCGDLLVKNSQPMSTGLAWLTPVGPEQGLTGFSHGTAGIAWALLHLATRTGRDDFRQTALQAIAYEQQLFVPEVGNWPDLRPLPPDVPAGFRIAWCHGATGIGLARLDTLPILDSPAIQADITAAIQTTLSGGFGKNHSLCHGDLGNLELLIGSGREEANHWAAQIWHSLQQDGPQCGVPLNVETPGLMNGLAGIGYGLLRLATPLPSPLLLQPPLPHAQFVIPHP